MNLNTQRQIKHLVTIVVLTFSTFHAFGQSLSLNETTSFYEYSKIKDTATNGLINIFKKRLESLNYKEIEVSDSSIVCKGFTNHLVGGFATVEITYVIKLFFKSDRYKLTVTNFILTDKNGSNPLEGLGSYKKKWIGIIDKKLPEIIKNIEALNKTEAW